ncbi:elongation of very long chain fatty acids protein 5-like [Paramacrobiotus metropolitanus]|uniref:elongation of very long chain fatty acids protein 5-like n=1 Tax=Paramacrobiotus metropolitanus TaxID=2943436 RepID=UPI002445FEB8|nr:elongation of very long chain fatty acids protein 5-like [Paramacrobiotus metropolitanus]XP_055330851.1 elongation of very long chain fatty acids protein 5-like [Paramacrobiotus metropolitanus]
MVNGTGFSLLQERYRNLTDIIYENSDVRSRDMLFMRRLDLVIMVLLGYIAFAVLGPKLMARYKPLELKWPMFAYNVAIAIWSLWMFLELLINSRISNYNYICDPYTLSYEPSELRIVNAMWHYWLSKGVEFLDTGFMVFKKKNSQITFLHVYHHTFMFPFLFFGVLFGPCGQAIVGPIMNTFVHVVMYSYYAMSLFPALQPYLWWKKYLTQLQLVQFIILLTLTANGLYSNCAYPHSMGYIQLAFMVSLIILFSNFYLQAYIKRHRKSHSSPSRSQVVSDEKKEL